MPKKPVVIVAAGAANPDQESDPSFTATGRGEGSAASRAAPWLLCAIAMLAGGIYCWHCIPGCYKYLDEGPKIAAHVARGEGFLNPIDASPASPPSAWLPPVYPLLMAGVYRVWGIATPTSLDVMLGINVVCFGLVVAAACVLGRDSFGAAAGAASGVLVLVYPTFLLRSVYLWDTLPSLAAFGWLTVAAVRMGRRSSGGVVGFLLLGSGLGLLVQLNACYVFCVPVLVLLAGQRLIQPLLLPIAAAVCGFVVVLTPWTIRNERVFHELFFVRAGVNLELWLGNRPDTTGWMDLSQHPSVNRNQGREMIRMGEPAYYALCGQRFRRELRQAPGAFVRRCVNRVIYLAVGNPAGDATKLVRGSSRSGALRVALDSAVLLAGVAGAAAAWRRGSSAGAWLLGLGVAAVLPFTITHVTYRYSMPLRMVCLITAGALFVPRASAPPGLDR
jgi:4-amino-4-deoxy-L-arabinose transferase-like glycosyltransferase